MTDPILIAVTPHDSRTNVVAITPDIAGQIYAMGYQEMERQRKSVSDLTGQMAPQAAPVAPPNPAHWGNKPNALADHPRGCACGLCAQHAAPVSAPTPLDLSGVVRSKRDWPTGDYVNQCCECRESFLGPKQIVACKKCVDEKAGLAQPAAPGNPFDAGLEPQAHDAWNDAQTAAPGGDVARAIGAALPGNYCTIGRDAVGAVVVAAIRAGQVPLPECTPQIKYWKDNAAYWKHEHETMAKAANEGAGAMIKEHQAEIAAIKPALYAAGTEVERLRGVVAERDQARADLARANKYLDDSEADADHWKSRHDTLEGDKATLRADLTRATAERDGLNTLICEAAELQKSAVRWRSQFGAVQEQAEKNARMCDKLTAELAGAKALLREAVGLISPLHSMRDRIDTIVAAGGSVK